MGSMGRGNLSVLTGVPVSPPDPGPACDSAAAAQEWSQDERTQPLVAALVDGLTRAETFPACHESE